MACKYKVSWYGSDGKRKSIIVETKAEMIAEVADKTTICNSVSVKVISNFKLDRA